MVNYFGYGANRSKQRIAEIIGVMPEGGIGAILNDYQLGYQSLQKIPPSIRGIFEQVWGNNFKSYTLIPGKGMVAGVIWQMDENQFSLIKKWEYIDVWKEIVKVRVKRFDGIDVDAVTEKILGEAIEIKLTDGLYYKDNINLDKRRTVLEAENDEFRIKKIAKILKELKALKKPNSITSTQLLKQPAKIIQLVKAD